MTGGEPIQLLPLRHYSIHISYGLADGDRLGAIDNVVARSIDQALEIYLERHSDVFRP